MCRVFAEHPRLGGACMLLADNKSTARGKVLYRALNNIQTKSHPCCCPECMCLAGFCQTFGTYLHDITTPSARPQAPTCFEETYPNPSVEEEWKSGPFFFLCCCFWLSRFPLKKQKKSQKEKGYQRSWHAKILGRLNVSVSVSHRFDAPPPSSARFPGVSVQYKEECVLSALKKPRVHCTACTNTPPRGAGGGPISCVKCVTFTVS